MMGINMEWIHLKWLNNNEIYKQMQGIVSSDIWNIVFQFLFLSWFEIKAELSLV